MLIEVLNSYGGGREDAENTILWCHQYETLIFISYLKEVCSSIQVLMKGGS